MTRSTIGINLLWLVPDAVGGSEQSTVATLRGLIDLDPPDLDLRLFVLPAFAAAHPEIVGALPTEVASIDGRSRIRRVVAESTWLAQRTSSLDLVHHAGGTVPARRSAPCVLTIHDLQPLQAQAHVQAEGGAAEAAESAEPDSSGSWVSRSRNPAAWRPGLSDPQCGD